ncbi:YcnI family protein [soil metagenome]
MNAQSASKIIAACALCVCALPAFSHISLDSKTALAGSVYKAAFQVGHGCQGSATTGISVHIPTGFQGAKPYPKTGWTLVTTLGKLAKPYDHHGKPVSEDVTVVTWTAASKDAALQDAHFDEFMLRGKLPETAGPLWFKVLQTCENGRNDWSETPASGSSAKGLKSPAVLLEVTAQEASSTPATVHAPGAHQH